MSSALRPADFRALTRAHRRALVARLPEAPIVVGSAPEIVRNGDVHFRYRQSSDLLWLTGVEAPGTTLLLDGRSNLELLFVQKPTQVHAVWLGHVPSRGEVRAACGVREVRHADELPRWLARLSRRRPWHTDVHGARSLAALAPRPRVQRTELREALDELRIVKDERELRLMRQAAAATDAGHLAAMRCARPGWREYQVQAELERAFLHAGCQQLGYGSIVGAGRNAAVLHYHRNDAPLRSGQLLLIDAGAEQHGYTADVTRTFPVGGRFSPRQRAVYEVVLRAQEACIARARAGVASFELQALAERTLAEGLRDLGLLQGSLDELVETRAVRVFFPHGIGHTLGLDVHDVQGGRRRELRAPRNLKVRFRARLEPGFAITVEPGLYFIPALLDDSELQRRHRGRVRFDRAQRFLDVGGVRIEDDIVVRPSGPPLNLTRAPKRVADVEAACSR